MKEYSMRWVYGHVEVYDACGRFCFSADSEREAMAELARRGQAEADERLSRLHSRFEYLLVIVLCAAVGLVLLSVMLPLLGVLSAIGG